MTIKVGETVPLGKFATVPYTPELESGLACGVPQKFTTEAWKGKKVVIFAVPGAFTPTCHVNHLPPYIKNVAAFKAKGVDVIAVLSANDPFVLSGWARVEGIKDEIIAVSDLDGAWSKELGLSIDLSGAGIGLGVRTTRYAIVLDDLKVTYVGVEPDPTQVSVSGAEPVLAAL